MTHRDSTPLISRQVLFGNPDKARPCLSPDGRQIAYLAPVDGVLNVWVGPVEAPETARPVTQDTYRGIRFYAWAYTGQHILYIQDKGGDENWRVYSVNLANGEIQDLTPLEGVHATIQEISPKHPHDILVGLNDRDPALHDLYRIDLNSGGRKLVQENPGFARFVTDDELAVRFAVRVMPDGGAEWVHPSEIVKPAGGGGWTLFIRIEMEDFLTTTPIGFDKAGKTVYMFDSRGRNTAALVALDAESGTSTLLAEDDRADVDSVMIHPTEKNVQAAAFSYERKHWLILDNAIAGDLAALRGVADGDVEVVSRTLDDLSWIVAYLVDNGPVRYYLYDRRSKQARFLFTNRQALEGLPLARMHPQTIPSRDGWDLVCYYTLPLHRNVDRNGLPDEPLPTVLLVHGGPWGRDVWEYDPWHQWLANRGYAVLNVNFRASTGLGKAFTNAGNREWSGKMHDDLIDAVHWAVERGIADPKRIAIMGGSYGGYATLVGLTFTPETFACGVDIVGPSNLVTLLETTPPYWAPQIEMFTTRIGDHRTEEGRAFLKQCSPLTHAGRIGRPLLIGQGANDPRVKQAESDQIVQAMQERAIPVTYVLYPDEGHGFARPENTLSFNAIAEAFLSRCLGGRYEPVGDDFTGATLTVLAGAEGVPGLAEALAGRVEG